MIVAWDDFENGDTYVGGNVWESEDLYDVDKLSLLELREAGS